MSTTADLIVVLKKELKNSQMTYADLAKELDMAESSVKRMFAKTDMPLSRIDAICRILKLDFAEVTRRVANTEVLLQQLTDDQKLPRNQKEGYTLLLGMRQWEFAAFTALRRDGA